MRFGVCCGADKSQSGATSPFLTQSSYAMRTVDEISKKNEQMYPIGLSFSIAL
jgi:hypothetical protein